MKNKKAVIMWSGGKDAALALHNARQNGIHIEGLCTTIDPARERVNMHDVRISLIDQQAKSLGLKLCTVPIGTQATVDMYRKGLIKCFRDYKATGITHIIVGDIYLEDVKEWREELIREAGLEPIFPLWKQSTNQLMRQFIDLGYRAVIICTNARYLDHSWLGRELNEQFIDDLPSVVDPCGEQGEYHSFVYDGPTFKYPIAFEKGDIQLFDMAPDEKEELPFDTKFWYMDLLPVEQTTEE